MSFAADRVINNPKKEKRSLSFAMQIKACLQGDTDILLPQLEDILDLPIFLPNDSTFQKSGMNGIVGFSIYLTEHLQTIHHCRHFNQSSK